MKLGHGHEVKFDLVHGTVTRYVVVIDGENTMAIQCDTADADKTIKILSLNGEHCLPTKGRFAMTAKMTEDVDGAPLGMETRVDSKSVYQYVVPRLHRLMAQLLRAATA